ncbi:MAG: hypothetical protein QNJ54_28545 [Prochloraceae cyanobacterium]|nr:hypothetical protein [Prochloraceae cyanobacterium]
MKSHESRQSSSLDSQMKKLSPLEMAVSRYQGALASICESQLLLSREHILEVFNARDALMAVLSAQSEISGEIQKQIVALDTTLKQLSTAISKEVDLAAWRSSLNPPQEAWWWFLETFAKRDKLESAIGCYKTALSGLEEKTESLEPAKVNHSLVQSILDVFIARDALQQELNNGKTPGSSCIKVNQLDRRFKEQFQRLPQKISHQQRAKLVSQLEEFRALRHPPREAWWWFVRIPVYFSTHLDGIWDIGTIIWLIAIFTLAIDISLRFLSSGAGLGFSGSFAVTSQMIISLLSGGSLTKEGQAFLEKKFKHWKIPSFLWSEFKFGAASALLIFLAVFYNFLPRIATQYNNLGIEDYKSGQLDNAESKYKLAISLNRDYREAHYNLAVLYEDLQDEQKARNHYIVAVEGGSPGAMNNLARLNILSEKYSLAVYLLEKGIFELKKDSSKLVEGNAYVEYSLFKNLGWARLKQERYGEALDALTRATNIETIKRKASAYCLLGQVQEKLGKNKQALEAWSNCDLSLANPNTPEEDQWIYQAQQKLKEAKTQNEKTNNQ